MIVEVSKNMKLCAIIFCMFYVNTIMAMENEAKVEKIGLSDMPKYKTDEFDIITENLNYHDLSTFAQANKTLFTKIQDSPTSDIINPRQSIVNKYENDIAEFMQNRHDSNYECVKFGDGYYPDFKCKSILNKKVTFSGNPGFQIEKTWDWDSDSVCYIIGPISGQGKDKQITEAMYIQEINGSSSELYATILHYWTKDQNIEYTLTFGYSLSKDEAKILFQGNTDLGLSNIDMNYADEKHMLKYYYIAADNYTDFNWTDNVDDTYDTMDYTFLFKNSKYNQDKQ